MSEYPCNFHKDGNCVKRSGILNVSATNRRPFSISSLDLGIALLQLLPMAD